MIRRTQMSLNSPHNLSSFLFRNVPNGISLARLLATPILLSAVLYRRPDLFKWLLLASLLSDILDGLIARIFKLRSRLGATIDSIADIFVTIIMIAGVWVFHEAFVRAHALAISLAVGLFLLEIIVSFWRYGRVSSYHTIVNRISVYAQGIFVMSLFLWGYQWWLFYPMITLAIIASLEEFLLLYLLPECRMDVRGAYWVLSNREITSK
jgi:CDP-diacylglycerol--glycerol-3-phosphate 3-phosphatidyltransferase